jgi:hypothetical protein
MSTIKTNNAQIGQSATANQNFTLYQPSVPDGTVRLGVGNSGATTADAVTVTNAGNATLLGNLTVSGAGTSTFAGTLNATTALQSGGIAAERIVQGTAQATTSGTAFGYTGLPTWVKRITVLGSGLNVASGQSYLQLGSGSYQSTGYTDDMALNYTTGSFYTRSNSTSGFWIGGNAATSSVTILSLLSPSSNTWMATGSLYCGAGPYQATRNSYVTLAGTLDRLQITASGGYTAGTVNIIYEG